MYAIRVFKAQRKLELWNDDTLEKEYPIAIGESDQGHKLKEGDHKTPEGNYRICVKNPESKFHLSLGVNYPNNDDARAAYFEKRISLTVFQSICMANDNGKRPPWDTCLGGEIYIHGDLESKNWSEGCIRMYNADIEELFEKTKVGTSVIIST